MCDRCAALEDEVAYLRARLADRLNTDLVRVIADAFCLAPAESRLIAALYQARGIVPTFDLELHVGRDPVQVERRLDTCNVINVLASRIRARVADPGFITPLRGMGWRISNDARRRIAEAVQEDADLTMPMVEALPPEGYVRNTVKWTGPKRRELFERYRLKGESLEDVAVAMNTTRNTIAGAVRRFGYTRKIATVETL